MEKDRQKLVNPEGISEFEFRMFELNHDLRFDTVLSISPEIVVGEHGAVNRFICTKFKNLNDSLITQGQNRLVG